MTQISDKQLDELRRIHAKLTQFLAAFDEGSFSVDPAIAKQVQDLIAKRICLACHIPIPEGDRPRRGQDSACYATTRARIRRGETTEKKEVEAGLMTAESKSPGRPAKRDRLAALEARNEATQKSADAKRGRKRKEPGD